MGKKQAGSTGIDRIALANRRKRAISLYRKGLTQYRIAKDLGVSFEAVSNWIEIYKDKGMKGLESLGKPGPRLGTHHKNNIKEDGRSKKIINRVQDKKSAQQRPNILGHLFKLVGGGDRN